MTDFLMQQALGADWHKLPRLIQKHYEVSSDEDTCLEGTMTIAYPNFMLPMIWLIHQFGGLILRRDTDVHTRVQKSANATGKILNWHRTLTYRDGKVDYFRSQMAGLGEQELTETIGYGFGLRLKVEVCNGDLVYRSNGHYWQCGRLHLTIPDWLMLGSATISEHALSESKFYLNFTINHPVWGETYSYRGTFRDC